MIKVVLDTNVIVSAFNFGGNPYEILDMVNRGVVELVISPFILDETSSVLKRQFGWSDRKIKWSLALIESVATVVYPTEKLTVIKAKDSDNRILECAVTGRANFIISGDSKHILPLKEYAGIKIFSPVEFLSSRF